MEKKRGYDSPLRKQRAEQTRTRILDALAEELSTTGLAEVSVPKVAKRAGVSVRTVYTHFATKEALLDALGDHWDSQIPSQTLPLNDETLPTVIGDLFAYFDANAELMLATKATAVGRSARKRQRARRTQARRAEMEAMLPNLSEAERLKYLSIIRFLISSAAWQELRELFDMDGAQSAEAVTWAVQTLFADAKRRDEEAADASD